MSNPWEEIWKDQADFNKNFRELSDDFNIRSVHTRELVLGMFSELDELLRTTDWKTHRRRTVFAPPPNIRATEDEIADLFKYLVSICQVWGLTPEDLTRIYWRKSMVMRQRYAEEFLLQLKPPFALIDMDGVLSDYPSGFYSWYHRNYKPKILDSWMFPSAEALLLDASEFREIQHAFRISGEVQRLPCYEGSTQFTQALREKGYRICIFTARSIDEYPNLYADTLHWLEENQISFDAIWWVRSRGTKATQLARLGLVRDIAFAVDDDYEECLAYARSGVKIFMPKRSYNERFKSVARPHLNHVNQLEEILNVV